MRGCLEGRVKGRKELIPIESWANNIFGSCSQNKACKTAKWCANIEHQFGIDIQAYEIEIGLQREKTSKKRAV